MVFLDVCLSHFLQPAAVCPEAIGLRAALQALTEQESDCLVLVDETQRPLGLLRLQQMLPLLTQPATNGKAEFSVEPPLRELLTVTPLVLLPIGLTLRQFLPCLRSSDPANYALIDSAHTFQGLLDQVGLQRILTQHWSRSANSSRWASSTPSDPSSDWQSSLEQRRLANPHVSRALPSDPCCDSPSSDRDYAEAEAPLSRAQTIPPSLLTLLLELLDRLPVPLMLQTSNGQVLSRNQLWQKHVADVVDPELVSREAGTFLNSNQTENRDSVDPTAWVTFQSIPSDSEERSATQADLLAGAVCKLGQTTDTCVCVCPLKNGQERILQFVKIPLGELSHLPGLTQPPTKIRNLPSQSHPFQLATLASAVSGVGTGIASPVPAEDLWLVLAQDLTDQQQLTRELTAKNADLIQLNRLKDEFLACVSHELRTPLTAILGLSSLLKDQTLGNLSQRQAHYAQLIYQSGRHLMTVVNDILDLTRMETGQLDLLPEPVSIAAVCQHAYEQAKQLRLTSDRQNAGTENDNGLPGFTLEIESDLSFITADELRLRQMLVHLLSNALKFTAEGGQVGLKVGWWDGWVAFTIWDTGIGIPVDRQHLIFQKFQQLENPLTRRFEGTGLGLVLTQRLARLHGGDVTFVSHEGKGSQFTILLPPTPPVKAEVTTQGNFGRSTTALAAEMATSAEVIQSDTVSLPQARKTGSRLVLIVEVVPQAIEALSEHLSGMGYRVAIARSGTEAVEKARRLQPCILFLNPVLPLLSGWDVLTLLKSNPETQRIPVVITASKVDEEQAHHSPADDWLSVPIQRSMLRQTLQRLIPDGRSSPLNEPNPANALTILRLRLGNWEGSADGVVSEMDLNMLLHSHHHRVLEADDLEQAELLARVWKPNVVLMDCVPHDPAMYFRHFSQHTYLSSLPLVTLDPETTQAANQAGSLLVFPCLAPPQPRSALVGGEREPSALLQVIQIAAGYAWRPTLLLLDLTNLPELARQYRLRSPDATAGGLKETEWLQALTQYLKTADFRTLVGHSCQEVLQQISAGGIDLVLIRCTETEFQPWIDKFLFTLQQRSPRLPFLVLDHRSPELTDEGVDSELPPVLQRIASQMLPSTQSMADLLGCIQRLLEE